MNKLTGIVILLLASISSRASHISGGELYYRTLSVLSNGNIRYEITLRLFRDCDIEGAQVAEMPTVVTIGIFNNRSGYPPFNDSILVQKSSESTIQLGTPSPCIINPPKTCYDVGYYRFQVELPKTPDGYLVSYQTCCRINSISNTVANSPSQNRDPGVTYIGQIPGTNTLGADGVNSSPVFNLSDTALACRGNYMKLNFGAVDSDNDSLTYEFGPAYGSGTRTDASNLKPFSPTTYNNLTYQPGYGNGTSPLGPDVAIDRQTGIISGIAPAGGIIRGGISYFVVNVNITEWRKGVAIGYHRKDFILKITDCQIAEAELPLRSTTCDGLTYDFFNGSNSPLIRTYDWDFGVPGAPGSNEARPSFTFPDAGEYAVKLVINKGDDCSDSATMELGVYPGFTVDFDVVPGCIDVPVEFIDRSTTNYGVVDSWKWNFGDLTTNRDTSTARNNSWKYADTGEKIATLIATNDKGCIDTATAQFNLPLRPAIDLPFRDTLICDVDDLQLLATTQGTIRWSPDYNIDDLDIANPIVSPDQTTTYYIDIEYLGCRNKDSVVVNVISEVELNAGNDTTICLTDPATLKPITNGLYFEWTPSGTLDRANVRNPVATPVSASTTYTVRASVGKCFATDDVTIFAFPYPVVDAGADHTICTDSLLILSGSHNGDLFEWSPQPQILRDGSTLTPTVSPRNTRNYTLTTRFLSGCLKPVSDVVTVNVIPPVPAFAGNDTSIVIGQPLQMNATGGSLYEWSPPNGLSDAFIFNPVALLNQDQVYSVKVMTPENCYAFDTIAVKVFNTAPDIFVPNAFTPNGDGHNDVFRPIPVGIETFRNFKVFNRWGQLVFSTSTPGDGWDGKIKGILQGNGTYVWFFDGVDYTGKEVFRKGNVSLVK